jgi:hypothetical protein
VKCRDCHFLSEPRSFGASPGQYVRCRLGLWDKKGHEQWYSYRQVLLNRGPVKRLGEVCTRGDDGTHRQ